MATNSQQTTLSRWQWRDLVAEPALWLTILGGFLRLVHLGGVRHNYDNSYSAWQALRLLEFGEWPIIGQPSSVFLDNPPLMAYLQSLLLLPWRSLWPIYIGVALGNTIAIWFVYDLTRQLLGRKAALVATFLFVVNPWLIHFSRQPWTQGLMPLYVVVLAWCMWPTLCGFTQPKRFFFGFIALIALTQSYILAFAILGPLALLWVLFYRHLPLRSFGFGCALFLLSLVPFWFGLQSQSDRNSSKFSSFVTEDFLQLRSDPLKHAVRYVTGLDYTGQDLINVEVGVTQPLLQIAHYGLTFLLLCGIATAVYTFFLYGENEAHQRPLATILLISGGLPILGFTLFPFIVHPHYQQLTFPALHMLVAWGVVQLTKRDDRLYGVVVAVCVAFAVQFWLNLGATHRAVAQAPTAWELDMWSLSAVTELGDTMQTMMAEDQSPIRVIAPSNEQLVSSISGRVTSSTADIHYPNFVVLPAQEPLYYVLRDTPAMPEMLGPTAVHLNQYDLTFDPNTQIKFIRVDPIDRDQSGALPSQLINWPSSTGVTLIGYDLDQQDQVLNLTSYWRVDQLYPQRHEWYSSPTYQLVNDQFQMYANVSENGQWGHQWQMGDVYIERVQIPLNEDLPSGGYKLLVKQVDSVHNVDFPFILNDGAADFAEIPLEIDR